MRLHFRHVGKNIEDNKWIRRNSKQMDRQYNLLNEKGQTLIHNTIHSQLKVEQHEPNKKKLTGNAGTLEG